MAIETQRLFVPARTVKQNFSLTEGSFAPMRKELFALYLNGSTYRFPNRYLTAYEESLDQQKAGIKTARAFARTREASNAIRQTQELFYTWIRDNETNIDPQEFAELVEIEGREIAAWRDKGLEVAVEEEWFKHRMIPPITIVDFCTFTYPRSFPQQEDSF